MQARAFQSGKNKLTLLPILKNRTVWYVALPPPYMNPEALNVTIWIQTIKIDFFIIQTKLSCETPCSRSFNDAGVHGFKGNKNKLMEEKSF